MKGKIKMDYNYHCSLKRSKGTNESKMICCLVGKENAIHRIKSFEGLVKSSRKEYIKFTFTFEDEYIVKTFEEVNHLILSYRKVKKGTSKKIYEMGTLHTKIPKSGDIDDRVKLYALHKFLEDFDFKMYNSADDETDAKGKKRERY